MKHWWLICVCALLFAAASVTADDHVPFTMIGRGGLSCGKFIDYQKQPNNKAQMDVLVQWVWGFISAYNARGFFDVSVQRQVSQVTPPDESTVLLFMGQFCARAPTSYLVSGTLALIKDLGGAVAGRLDEIK
jgi:hypothetical protein